MSEMKSSPANDPALRRVLFYLAATILLAGAWYFRAALLPVILAAFLAYLLSPAVRLGERGGLSTHLSIAFVYLLLAAVLVLTGTYLFPKLVVQMESLARSLPRYTQMVSDMLQVAQRGMLTIPLPQTLQSALLNVVDRWEMALQTAVEGAVDELVAALPHAMSLIAAPVLAYYFLQDRSDLMERVRKIVPIRWRAPVLQLITELDLVLLGYIRSRILVSALVGMAAALIFVLLDLPYSLLVGLFAGVTDLIPYFGPILGAVPAVAVAAAESPRAVIWVLGSFFIIQQMESYLISPLVMSDGVKLHPAWVVIALFLGARVAGLLGMIVAVPVFACARVIGEFALQCWPGLNPLQYTAETDGSIPTAKED